MGKLSIKAGGYLNTGLLIMRIGIGLMFLITHGGPKLMGGAPLWEKVGSSMGNFGIHSGYVYWGLAAGIAEALGGLLVMLGLLFVPGCLLIIFVMIVATVTTLAGGMGFAMSSHSIEIGIVVIALLFTGPGRYSLDEKIF